MNPSTHPLPLETLQRESLDLNPFLHTVSQEIHLPFSYEDYTNSTHHQASLLHEYTHLVQSLSTTYGASLFVGLSERLALFFNAIQGRQELSFPIVEWASHEVDDETLGAYAQYERQYQTQRIASDGHWRVEITADADDFALREETKTIGGQQLTRWHVIRKIGVDTVAIPLLGLCLSEAQAECVATYFQDIPSVILEKEGRESDVRTLVYTSVNGLVRRLLPNYPTLEATYFLTEYALMTHAPDVAFVSGIGFLKDRPPPLTIGEWKTAWADLDERLEYQKKSVTELAREIDKKIALFSQHAGDIIINLLIERLSKIRSLVFLKESNPFQFFPWQRTTEWLEQELLSHIPVAAAHFTDGIYSLGSPSRDYIQTQNTLSAAAFLLAALAGEKPIECPLIRSASCVAERTLDCKQFPWGRGDIGGGRTCTQGALGRTLGIDSSTLSAVTTRYKP